MPGNENENINSNIGQEEDEHDASQSSAADMHGDGTDNNMPPKEEEIGKAEDKAVFCLRFFVLLVLVLAAVGVSIAVFTHLDDSEVQLFRDHFDSDAAKVFESIGGTLDNTLGPADSLIANLLAYARATNSTFPFVTLPSYGLQAAKLLRVSKAMQMHMSFVVEQEQKEEWEAYAAEKRGWIDEAIAIEEGDPNYNGYIHKDWYNPSCDHIFTWGGIPLDTPSEAGLGTYIPNWHEFPIMGGAAGNGGCSYNHDHWQTPAVDTAARHMIQTQRTVIGNFPIVNFNISDPFQADQRFRWEGWVRLHVPVNVEPYEPFTQMAIPIYDAVDSVYVNVTTPQKFVGFLAFTIHLRNLIEGILPPNSNGIILVVEQSCGNPFTYRIDGADVTYLGVGDHHDTKYDNDMVYSAVMEELLDSTKTGRESSYTGIPIDSDFCPNTLTVYPSQDMEDNHRSKQPIIFAIIAASIFVFTSLVFLMYDILVSRRQKIVKDRALASGAIVSSLFPDEVKHALYMENKEKMKNEEGLNSFKVQETVPNLNPLAKNYDETTIFFADLAGFTSWSSKRQPPEVFMLLETLYGAFDAIALRLKVFKVETIGDCYVAITGVPDPQSNHAVIMVKFAKECMKKMSDLTQDLVGTLGGDTADLGFRVGLHSGSVTAGVLRGQKARFQLFGDTVNTAARMESNGIPGRIHISQDTADCLLLAGKGSWLVPREEKIVAKGKGEMQTYFASPPSSKSKSTMSGSTSGCSEDQDDL